MQKTVLNSLKKRADLMEVQPSDLASSEIKDFNFPALVTDMAVYFAEFYDVSALTVVSCIMTSWLAFMNAWNHYQGADAIFSVAPFVRDEDDQVIQGDDLYAALRFEYGEAIKADTFLMNKAREENRKQRAELKKFAK